MCTFKVDTNDIAAMFKKVSFPKNSISEYVEVNKEELTYTVYDGGNIVRCSIPVKESTCENTEFGIDIDFFKTVSRIGHEVEVKVSDNFVTAKGIGRIKKKKKEYSKPDIDMAVEKLITQVLPYDIVKAAANFCGDLDFSRGIYIESKNSNLAVASTDRAYYFCAIFNGLGTQDSNAFIAKEDAKLLSLPELGVTKDGLVVNKDEGIDSVVNAVVAVPQLSYEFPASPFDVEEKFAAFKVHEEPNSITLSCPIDTFLYSSSMVSTHMLEGDCEFVEDDKQIALKFTDMDSEEIVPLIGLEVEQGDVNNLFGKRILIKKLIAFERIAKKLFSNETTGVLVVGENFGVYKVKSDDVEIRLYFSLVKK